MTPDNVFVKFLIHNLLQFAIKAVAMLVENEERYPIHNKHKCTTHQELVDA